MLPSKSKHRADLRYRISYRYVGDLQATFAGSAIRTRCQHRYHRHRTYPGGTSRGPYQRRPLFCYWWEVSICVHALCLSPDTSCCSFLPRCRWSRIPPRPCSRPPSTALRGWASSLHALAYTPPSPRTCVPHRCVCVWGVCGCVGGWVGARVCGWGWVCVWVGVGGGGGGCSCHWGGGGV